MLLIQVSVHPCRVYPLDFVIAPEQWNLSEAEESNGSGVHHYPRKPRHAVTLEWVMDVVKSLQRHSISLIGDQSDRVSGSMSSL